MGRSAEMKQLYFTGKLKPAWSVVCFKYRGTQPLFPYRILVDFFFLSREVTKAFLNVLVLRNFGLMVVFSQVDLRNAGYLEKDFLCSDCRRVFRPKTSANRHEHLNHG